MIKKWFYGSLIGFYILGWLADWAYYISIDSGINELFSDNGSIIIGWLPALFWPVHLFVKIWDWIL